MDPSHRDRGSAVHDREETSKYTDPLADGTARLFSFVMDAKSINHVSAYPVILHDRGWWEISESRGAVGAELPEWTSAPTGKQWEPASCSNRCSPSATRGFDTCGSGMAREPHS